MPFARDEIYYALMYVDYKSRSTSLSGILRAPKVHIPVWRFRIITVEILGIPAPTTSKDQMPDAFALSTRPCPAVPMLRRLPE